MMSPRCMRCGQWWTHNAGAQKFTVITTFCPTCIPLVLPVMGVTPMPKRARRDRLVRVPAAGTVSR